jgi:integrase
MVFQRTVLVMRLSKQPNSPNWFLEVQFKNKKYIRSTKTDHKPTAKKIAEDLYRQIQLESVQGRVKNIRFKDAAENYFIPRKDSPSASGLKGTMNAVLKIIDGNIHLSELTGKHFTDFVEHRKSEGRKPQTIKHGVQFISAVMKQAKREGYNVADVEVPTISVKPTRLRYLSKEEEQRLLKELVPNRITNTVPTQIQRNLQDNYDLVVILLDTGARYGEIAKLTWQQIDLETRTINLWRSKVSNESVIFMTKRVHAVLERRFNNHSNKYLFTNNDGGPRRNNNIAIRKAFRRAGLNDCTIHTLRHTHATRLVQNGLSIYEVRSVLGHTDIKTTMRYAHLESVQVTEKARDVIEEMGG